MIATQKRQSVMYGNHKILLVQENGNVECDWGTPSNISTETRPMSKQEKARPKSKPIRK